MIDLPFTRYPAGILFIDTPVEHCISQNRTVGNVAGVWRSMTANELTKDGVRNPE
jgi:hypothetical protein